MLVWLLMVSIVSMFVFYLSMVFILQEEIRAEEKAREMEELYLPPRSRKTVTKNNGTGKAFVNFFLLFS